jgi:uncharacterized protein YjbI with pentapeptide repeats
LSGRVHRADQQGDAVSGETARVEGGAAPAPLAAAALRADCARCFGLCCVVPAFAASADFAIDKPAGRACPHLRDDFRCGIHATLRDRGFPGCTVFDCFGAGQQVSQVTFGGRNWRAEPRLAPQMFAVFPVMRDLHELLWYLTEAIALHPPGPRADELRAVRNQTARLTQATPDALLALDVAGHRRYVNDLLRQTSELVRSGLGGGAEYRGADLIGADLRGADLRGASLRGAYLIGADLRGVDLRGADLTGADLRGADLRGADLTGAIFLVQAQLDAARGDASTRLPPALSRPVHWPASASGGPGPARPPAPSRSRSGSRGGRGRPGRRRR